ncbi:hypothetical protein BURMUCGD1_5595 [Burkholderia multivorans CGD1]|nr:hypothetical protein BURMUCGD1_5595 [Burkholderia multivorans CGD1]
MSAGRRVRGSRRCGTQAASRMSATRRAADSGGRISICHRESNARFSE